MRFVLANRLLDHAGGTEVHLLTLGEQLQRLGHEVHLYSPQLGAFSDHARGRGLDVCGSIDDLPEQCDVAFAQDTIVSYDLVARYPQALTVFRVCGDVFSFQLPPQVPDVADLIVVLSDRYARVVRGCRVSAPVLRLRAPIDLDRLVPLTALQPKPRRAALLGNYPERTAVVTEACRRHGIEVVRVGGTQQSYDVAAALAEADIVFAKSRAALDAMACGRAVYVFDLFGGDGWVTAQSYAALEADNFAGLATDRMIEVDDLAADLDAYDATMGSVNRDLIVQHHHPRDHALALIEAIGAREPAPRPQAPLRELARLSALNWSWEQVAAERRSAQSAMHERIRTVEARAADTAAAAARRDHVRVDARVGQLEGELAAAQTRAAQLGAEAETMRAENEAMRAEIDAMRGTRTWRAATRWWRAKSRLTGPPRTPSG